MKERKFVGRTEANKLKLFRHWLTVAIQWAELNVESFFATSANLRSRLDKFAVKLRHLIFLSVQRIPPPTPPFTPPPDNTKSKYWQFWIFWVVSLVRVLRTCTITNMRIKWDFVSLCSCRVYVQNCIQSPLLAQVIHCQCLVIPCSIVKFLHAFAFA